MPLLLVTCLNLDRPHAPRTGHAPQDRGQSPAPRAGARPSRLCSLPLRLHPTRSSPQPHPEVRHRPSRSARSRSRVTRAGGPVRGPGAAPPQASLGPASRWPPGGHAQKSLPLDVQSCPGADTTLPLPRKARLAMITLGPLPLLSATIKRGHHPASRVRVRVWPSAASSALAGGRVQRATQAQVPPSFPPIAADLPPRDGVGGGGSRLAPELDANLTRT